MHEIRVTVEPAFAGQMIDLARQSTIDSITVMDVFEYGPDAPMKVVCVCTSTPKARAFVDMVLNEKALRDSEFSITSREVRAIINGDGRSDLTRPTSEPFPDVIQDLWQLSHVTPSYIARAASGGALLATGIIDNNPVAIVVAALFLPFLSEVLAIAFGAWAKDGALIRQGLRALVASIFCSLAGGLIVGFLEGGPVRFSDFQSAWHSFAISAIIGVTAGLSNADDTGRRYLIGVAAAVQLAIFPVWLGVVAAIGFPAAPVVTEHLKIFVINLATIAVTAIAAYAMLHLRRGGWKAPPSGKIR
ncbi:MAG TPA: DUF389 domain-containing protein [Patescibacteria group bacterium]|nr:DUF389 domain-containing protein [Patescibacteria group bacterium]